MWGLVGKEKSLVKLVHTVLVSRTSVAYSKRVMIPVVPQTTGAARPLVLTIVSHGRGKPSLARKKSQ